MRGICRLDFQSKRTVRRMHRLDTIELNELCILKWLATALGFQGFTGEFVHYGWIAWGSLHSAVANAADDIQWMEGCRTWLLRNHSLGALIIGLNWSPTNNSEEHHHKADSMRIIHWFLHSIRTFLVRQMIKCFRPPLQLLSQHIEIPDWISKSIQLCTSVAIS